MSKPDVFALRNSAFNTFLFADVGTELNGSTLTMLSALSRLGEDPWATAARWATLPQAAAIDSVAACIGGMPLEPAELAKVRLTATRLALLLPGQVSTASPGTRPAQTLHAMPKPLHLIVLCAALICAIAMNVVLQPRNADPAHPSAAPVSHGVPPTPGE